MRRLSVLAAAAALVVAAAPAADANRGEIPGERYRDVCKNVRGDQTILDVTGIAAPFRFIRATKRPNDCRPVQRVKPVRS